MSKQMFRRIAPLIIVAIALVAVITVTNTHLVSAASSAPNAISFDAFVENSTAITVPLGSSFSLTGYLTATEVSNLTVNTVTDLQNMYWWSNPVGTWYASGNTKSWVANTTTGQIRMVYNANRVGIHQILMQGGYLAGDTINKILTVIVTPPVPTCEGNIPSGEIRLIATNCTMEGDLNIGQTDTGPWTPLFSQDTTQAAVSVVLTDTWVLAEGNVSLSRRDPFRDIGQELLSTHDSVIMSVVQEPTIITRKVLGKLQFVGDRSNISFTTTYTTHISFDSCTRNTCFPGWFELQPGITITQNSSGWARFLFDSYWQIDQTKLKQWNCNTTSFFQCTPIPYTLYLPLVIR